MSEIVKNQRGGKRPGAGRPHKIVEAAQSSILHELFDPEAERAVVGNMIAIASTPDKQAVQAAKWLWDRVYGPVTEKTESHHTIDVTRLSDDELERLVKGG